MAKKPIVIDKGMKAAQRAIRELDGWQATIGIHGEQAPRPGEMDNVRLGVIHEFGVRFIHPGGTPFMMASQGGSSRSGGMVGSGSVIFLRKGDPRAIGVTRPHQIVIPERSFLRSTWDKNLKKYERLLVRLSRQVVSLKLTPQQAIGRLGERVKSDVVNAINRGIPPPIKPATARRKGSTKPLIDLGASGLKGSIKSMVSK